MKNDKRALLAKLKELAEKADGKKIAAGILTGVMLSTGALTTQDKAIAAVQESEMTVEAPDDQAQIARTTADWHKLLEDYREIDCNLDVDAVEAYLEIEEFIETTYNAYFSDELSYAFTVDSVLNLRHASEYEFGFAKMLNDWNSLNREDETAVRNFLEVYGPYLADLHAHNYFTLITMISNIQNLMAYYVKQDVENADQLRAEYGFDQMQFGQQVAEGQMRYGEVAPDLTSVKLYYTDANSAKHNVNVAITGSTDPAFGNGFADIQGTYIDISREVAALGTLMTTGVSTEGTATYESYGVRAYTLNNGVQVYEIIHNDRINDLIRRGVRVNHRFNPAQAYYEQYVNGEIDGVTLTKAGYGHYLQELGNIQVANSYDEAAQEYNHDMVEVFELPQIELDIDSYTMK